MKTRAVDVSIQAAQGRARSVAVRKKLQGSGTALRCAQTRVTGQASPSQGTLNARNACVSMRGHRSQNQKLAARHAHEPRSRTQTRRQILIANHTGIAVIDHGSHGSVALQRRKRTKVEILSSDCAGARQIGPRTSVGNNVLETSQLQGTKP